MIDYRARLRIIAHLTTFNPSMKALIPTTKEVEITHVLISIPVRYEEEDIPNDFPLRKGDMWEAKIEIDTGKILAWPEGKTGRFNMKVCDEGTYQLLDADGKIVLEIAQNYVPNDLIPGSYGDYVCFEINDQGVVTNWPKRPDIRAFIGGEDE